jgi:hypothetical protein
MGIHYLGKRREALGLTGEQYKQLVREFLEQSGYALMTDSSIEGHLADMVLIHPEKSVQKEYWVECKATNVGPNEKGFVKELMHYFLEWLRDVPEERFTLFVFAIKFNDIAEFEKLFGAKYSKKNLQTWYENHLSDLTGNIKQRLKDVKFKDVVHFFSQAEFYEADIDYLRNAIKEKSKRSIFSLQRYAENLLKESKRRSVPIRESSELYSNLLCFEFPKKYYVANTKYKKKEKIYERFNEEETKIPPFLYNPQTQQVSTFVPLTSDCPLTKIFTTDPKEVDITEKTSPQFIVAMINQHLKRILWKKGLTRISNTNFYYFQIEAQNGELKDRNVIVFERKKRVAHVYKKGDEENAQLNFVFHSSAEIRVRFFWGKYYIQIIPIKTYTTDGWTLIEGKKKSALDRFFRNPRYNRNSHRLSEIRFWKDLLLDTNAFTMPPEDWFNKFTFGELEVVPFEYVPQTTEREQTRLGEFI